MSTNESGADWLFTEELVVRVTPVMFDEINDFAWYRSLDPDRAVRALLKKGLSVQDEIRTSHGDRRTSDGEVVVDCSFC